MRYRTCSLAVVTFMGMLSVLGCGSHTAKTDLKLSASSAFRTAAASNTEEAKDRIASQSEAPTYHYRVVPIDAVESEGAQSNEATVTLIVEGADFAPPIWDGDVGVTLVEDTVTGVVVYWSTAADSASPPV